MECRSAQTRYHRRHPQPHILILEPRLYGDTVTAQAGLELWVILLPLPPSI